MTTTPLTPTQARPSRPPGDLNPWLLWRPEMAAQPEVLTVAELTECHCPDLCDRDHDND